MAILNKTHLVIIVGLVVLIPQLSFAQSNSGGEAEVENLYDSFDKEQDQKSQEKLDKVRKTKAETIRRLDDLVDLAPFEDVAVIQRKFLPKTGRFDIDVTAIGGLNNAFFTTVGLSTKASFYLSEKWGIELGYSQFTSASRDVTDNLRDNQNINTKSLVVAENYMGVALKWIPVYGKMAFLNETIVPFDIYFAPGAGVTKTQSGESASTFSISAGQVFALSKSMAFKWTFMWNAYQAEVEDGAKGTSSKKSKLQNDLFISAGMTFFFPEATYR